MNNNITINPNYIFISAFVLSTVYFYNKFKSNKKTIDTVENILNEFIRIHDDDIKRLNELTVLVKTMALSMPIRGEEWQMKIVHEKFLDVYERFNGVPYDETKPIEDEAEPIDYEKHM
jgi:hypothetical protein